MLGFATDESPSKDIVNLRARFSFLFYYNVLILVLLNCFKYSVVCLSCVIIQSWSRQIHSICQEIKKKKNIQRTFFKNREIIEAGFSIISLGIG